MYTVARSSTAIPNTMSSTRNTTVPASAASAATNTTAAVVPQRRFPDGVNRPADSKFCKVCYDAGLSVAEYTDHFVKDQPGPNGNVICRTLLHQACRICQRTGHTSSYCPQYRPRHEPRREEPRREERYREERYREECYREERYIEREPRREERYREERYIEREPRRDDRYREEPRREDRYREERYIEREPRREERYIERERDSRREEPRRGSFNHLREDTEHREREIRERDDAYYREQEEQRRRESTPWLQAVKQPRKSSHVPYAHPHGPRVRLNLEAPALSAAKHGTTSNTTTPPTEEDKEFFVIRGHQYPRAIPGAIDVLAVNLSHSESWGDEELDTNFNPDEMCEEFLRDM